MPYENEMDILKKHILAKLNGDEDGELFKRAETPYKQIIKEMAYDVNPNRLTGGEMKSVVLRVVDFLENLANISDRQRNSFNVLK